MKTLFGIILLAISFQAYSQDLIFKNGFESGVPVDPCAGTPSFGLPILTFPNTWEDVFEANWPNPSGIAAN